MNKTQQIMQEMKKHDKDKKEYTGNTETEEYHAGVFFGLEKSLKIIQE